MKFLIKFFHTSHLIFCFFLTYLFAIVQWELGNYTLMHGYTFARHAYLIFKTLLLYYYIENVHVHVAVSNIYTFYFNIIKQIFKMIYPVNTN